MKINCKPCFAFDALAAIINCNYCRNDIPEIKFLLDEKLQNINIKPSDQFFHLLVSHYSIDEIMLMDLNTLSEVYPRYIEENDFVAEFKSEILRGFEILKKLDFTKFWQNNILGILQNQCDGYLSTLESELLNDLMHDIQRVKSMAELVDINICMTYFMFPVSFQLTKNCYLTNYRVNDRIDAMSNSSMWGSPIRLFIHELIHGFSNEKLRDVYRSVYKNDKLMKKCNYILWNKKSSTSDEEEFVVALEHAISHRNGVMTKTEAYTSISNYYDNCMAIAAIVFNELDKLKDIPDDINSWMCNLFENGTIKIGEIENEVNRILPRYVEAFKKRWFSELNSLDNGKIPNELICYCGHDCSKCRTFLATLSDDNEMRKSIAEYYKAEFNQDIPIEKLCCLGGRSTEVMEGCRQCPYMQCCKDNNLRACSDCPQYPCQMLGWYIEKYVNKANQI